MLTFLLALLIIILTFAILFLIVIPLIPILGMILAFVFLIISITFIVEKLKELIYTIKIKKGE